MTARSRFSNDSYTGYHSCMATLRVRDLPDDIYQRVQHIAAARNQSLTVYVRTLLSEAVEREAQK